MKEQALERTAKAGCHRVKISINLQITDAYQPFLPEYKKWRNIIELFQCTGWGVVSMMEAWKERTSETLDEMGKIIQCKICKAALESL